MGPLTDVWWPWAEQNRGSSMYPAPSVLYTIQYHAHYLRERGYELTGSFYTPSTAARARDKAYLCSRESLGIPDTVP